MLSIGFFKFFASGKCPTITHIQGTKNFPRTQKSIRAGLLKPQKLQLSFPLIIELYKYVESVYSGCYYLLLLYHNISIFLENVLNNVTHLNVIMKTIVLLVSLVAWLAIQQEVSASSKLNLPRVLLPLFSKFAANYTLEISDNGCYEWQLSRLDVIQIIPLDVTPSGCSSRALISTISRELTRNTVIVIAEDVSSGETLRCDVIVDIIDSLHIVTKTRELYMEEAPEVFEVRAYDNQGNEFSTLDSVEFQWNIGAGGRVDQTVLRFMTFKDSPYETPSTVQTLDQRGQKGHMVLLEGLKTGSARVSVNLPYTEYQNVKPAEVNLMVVANLLIDPPDTYVLKGDTVKFRLLQLRHGRIVELSIPSSQYIFTIENPAIAEAIDSRGNMLALDSGRTKILLHYSHDMSIRLPHAFITVTEPQYLALSILPHRNWAVEVTKTYTILVDVYDAANRKFHLGDNAKIEVRIPKEYFNVKSSTANGTQHIGYPVKVGVASVEASLKAIGSYVYDSPLYTREELSIFSPVRVMPALYVLPWEENLKYQVVLKATGGDGSYSWSTSNAAIATVAQSGLVKTLGLGEVNISAAMTKAPNNRDSGRVLITRPSRLQIVDRFSLEAEVGRPIHLHVALYAQDSVTGQEIPFTNCQQLSFKVIIDDGSFRYEESANLKENVGLACANLAIFGSRIASSRVTVQYAIGDILLEDSAVIGTFNPLTTIQPARGQTVLAVGTSRHLAFTGGPSIKHQKKGTKKVDYDNSVVDIFDVLSNNPDVYIYSVLCKRVGETSVRVVIGSCATPDCKRSESVSIVQVFCSLPKLVSFHFDSKSKDCPLKSEINRISALNYRDVNVTVVVKDSKGRTFDNATSLYAEWLVSNATLAGVQFPGLVWLNASSQGNYLVPLNHFQIVKPRKKSGIVELTVKILHYRNVLLKKLNIPNDIHEFEDEISATAIIHFVEDTAVSKNSLLLFNHPKNKGTIEILPGSGHYRLTPSTDSVAQFLWDATDKHLLRVIPIRAGHMTLTVQDLCLQSHTTHVTVEVRQVSAIRVELVNKIQKGKHVLAAVKLYDSEDIVLPISQVEFFDLNVALSREDILSVRQHAVNISRSEILFQVTGLEIGVTNLVFSTSFSQAQIYSTPIAVTVYPPLVISPKHFVVPLNSKFHINAQGGPYPDCSYEFVAENESIKVLSNGMVEGVKLGTTRITGMAVGYVKGNKNKIVFSKDTAEVSVVQLEGVNIVAPVVKFMRGNTLPLYVTGSPNDLSPSVLSTLSPRLSFKWTTSSDIVSLSDIFSPLSIHLRDEDRLSVRLTGLRPGKAVIYLRVSSAASNVYTSSIQVEVFEDLFLTNPPNFRHDSLLLSPHATYQLRTNKNATGLKFSVLKNVDPTAKALAQVDSQEKEVQEVISVSPSGVVRAGNKAGQSFVSICESAQHASATLCKSVLIEVRPVQYLMLGVRSRLNAAVSSQTSDEDEVPILSLPQGMALEMFTSYHDEYGRKFTSARNDLQAETSRTDLIQLTMKSDKEVRDGHDGALIVSLSNAGESVLTVWDASLASKPRDYVKLNVDHLITPQKSHLVTGDVVCFSAPRVCGEGSWVSSAPDIFSIDPDLGIGRARNKPGTALVSYELPLCGIASSISVEVLLINAIHFVPTKNKTISNAPNQVYSADLVLFNNYEATTSKSNNLLRSEGSRCTKSPAPYSVSMFPFSCSAQFVSSASPTIAGSSQGLNMPSLDEIFTVKPAYSLKTGLYSCQFIPKGTLTNTTLHKAEVTLKAKSIHSSVSSGPLSFMFYPAPHVYTKEIAFHKFRPAALLVAAYPDVLKQITVSASHEGYVRIEQASSAVPTAQPFQIYPLEKTRTEPRSDLTILVHSPLTQQVISVPVLLDTEAVPGKDEACMLGFLPKIASGSQTFSTAKSSDGGFQLQIWIFLATIILAIVVIILVLEYFKTPHKGPARGPESEDTVSSARDYAGRKFPAAPLQASSPLYQEGATRVSPLYQEGGSTRVRRPFDELSPVYGSPSPVQRKRIVLPRVDVSQRSVNSSSLDNSW